MSTPLQNPAVDQERLAQAWDWAMRLRGEAPADEDLAQWLAWYEADERNKRAYDEVNAFSQQARKLALLPAPRARRLPRRYLPWAGAALAAGLAAVAVFGLKAPPAAEAPIETAVIAAGPAAAALVKDSFLPDGSRVELAANSSVALQYSERARMLELRDGVAYFTVAHNSERPFIVRAGNVYVRAVGTAFNVRQAGDRVVVTVAEGIVDVYPAATPEPTQAPESSVRIKAGREAAWEAQAATPSVTDTDPAHALAWRSGRLEYMNEPLSAVIADINRYSPQRVVLRDEAAGRIPFSGSVLTRATDSWLRALPTLFPVELHIQADGTVILASRG